MRCTGEALSPYTVRLKKEKIEEFLNKAVKLEAISIPNQMAENTGLDESALIVEIKGSGVSEKLTIGNKTAKDEYYIKNEKTGRIYLISNDNRAIFSKQIRNFQ